MTEQTNPEQDTPNEPVVAEAEAAPDAPEGDEYAKTDTMLADDQPQQDGEADGIESAPVPVPADPYTMQVEAIEHCLRQLRRYGASKDVIRHVNQAAGALQRG